ncbi:MAG TPA: molybdopterin-dependent oxidoreductase [Ramlibacter sp.]|nr:molybdopterin-dependent oxidoreductase [Ramlibacter sp.]
MTFPPLATLDCDLALSHWGAYEIERGPVPTLRPWREDRDPSPIGLSMLEAYRSPLRIQRPAVRAGWLRDRRRHGRGQEPFVEVSWDTALDLVAGELRRVIAEHGNRAILGGSYGWSSAGRFHHALSQVHRFLNATGGYVRQTDSYSLGAGRVVVPHIVGDMDQMKDSHTSWDVLGQHTRLFVTFGGVPLKNTQINAGGAIEHHARAGLQAMVANGCRFVHFGPVRADLPLPDAAVEWIPIRPNTDTAALLALAHEVVTQGLHDESFLASHCTGFATWKDYLLGRSDGVPKTPEWACAITGAPAQRLRSLARELAATRSLVNVAWSLQRADHGEQPFWACIGLAAVLGQVGLPGGGFGIGYGPANVMGSPYEKVPGAALPQGQNPVSDFIPCARVADLLLSPGQAFDYNGKSQRYADIRLVYWAGGNPFHHHQDLHRLVRAWARPETIVVHEQVWNGNAKMADIVLPATTTLERDDIGYASREPLLVAMRQLEAPPGEARDDYAIFTQLARRLGVEARFTEGRDTAQWLRHLYGEWADKMGSLGHRVPGFDAFWRAGAVQLPRARRPVVMLEQFRQDPQAHPLSTPSGRIELFSERVAGFGYPDCPGYPKWFEPAEWLGAQRARHYPLHLLSDQPAARLHSQLDFSAHSRAHKVAGREPILISVADARERGIADGDVVRVFNDRGSCLAGAVVTDALLSGVVKISTGAWWDPERPGDPAALDRHGNPNSLTRDAGASRLSQGCAAQTCLVQVEKHEGEAPPVRAYELPAFEPEGQP